MNLTIIMKPYFRSQCFLIIGYSIFFLSRFRSNKKSILITDTLSRLCFIAGYCLLGSVNSIEHTLYGIIRNVVGAVPYRQRQKEQVSWVSP